mgnify:CR=1 FL=1
MPLPESRKILSIILKLGIGIGSIVIIYLRLHSDLTPDKLKLLVTQLSGTTALLTLITCGLMMPLNWGIESYKWMIITAPIQKIGFGRAARAVYSGLCLGNFAPGRATEFIAKILFFEPKNRPQVTVLHFIGGMFQLFVTVLFGTAGILFRLNDLGNDQQWLAYLGASLIVLLSMLLSLCIFKADALLNFVSRRFIRNQPIGAFHYRFSGKLVSALFAFSILRFLVFTTQFVMIISIFHNEAFSLKVFGSVAIYFLITTSVPMFSLAEPAIRTAIALLVFAGCGIDNSVMAICTILLWIINIVLPSVAGYYFLVQENFNFKLSKKKSD